MYARISYHTIDMKSEYSKCFNKDVLDVQNLTARLSKSSSQKMKSKEAVAILLTITTIDLQQNILLAKKFRTFYFGRLIFRHFFSDFGQISEKDFGHFAKTLLKQI